MLAQKRLRTSVLLGVPLLTGAFTKRLEIADVSLRYYEADLRQISITASPATLQILTAEPAMYLSLFPCNQNGQGSEVSYPITDATLIANASSASLTMAISKGEPEPNTGKLCAQVVASGMSFTHYKSNILIAGRTSDP